MNDFQGPMFLAIAVSLYFCPSLIACGRHKRNALAIFALNLLVGWTVLGWIGALIWALTFDSSAARQA